MFWGPSEVPDAGKAREMQSNSDMFDYFVMVFATMRRPSRAMDVWKAMARVQVRPTVHTWTSFLRAASARPTRRPSRWAWEQLARSGLQLGHGPVWTARVSGLVRAGSPEAGLAALDEMRALWEEAQRSGRPSAMAVRPSVEPVKRGAVGRCCT